MRNILNGKVLIAVLVIAAVLLCASLVYILVARPAASNPNLAPASSALTVIPAPTSTPRFIASTLTPLAPTPTSSPSPAPGEIAVNVYVQITGTGGDGLNIRTEPGLDAVALFLAFDSEAFLVADGPREVDGYTWWYVTASYDTTRAGWAAQNYLTVITNP